MLIIGARASDHQRTPWPAAEQAAGRAKSGADVDSLPPFCEAGGHALGNADTHVILVDSHGPW